MPPTKFSKRYVCVRYSNKLHHFAPPPRKDQWPITKRIDFCGERQRSFWNTLHFFSPKLPCKTLYPCTYVSQPELLIKFFGKPHADSLKNPCLNREPQLGRYTKFRESFYYRGISQPKRGTSGYISLLTNCKNEYFPDNKCISQIPWKVQAHKCRIQVLLITK